MAAGLGFKDFVTGEVLTAADVDGYLMQGVWVFASAAARDAAVTSPQEGNFAYLKDTNVTTYYTGSAWANLDTTGMTNPMTTTGDTIYSSSGSTPARLGIGTAGQVLQVNSGATAPEWATPASGGGMTLLETLTMTGSSVTSSTIPGTYTNLFINGVGLYSGAAGGNTMERRFNGDTGANYSRIYINANNSAVSVGQDNNTTSVSSTNFATTDTYLTAMHFTQTIYRYSNATHYKDMVTFFRSNTNEKGTYFDRWNSTAAITSLTFFCASNSFSGGTIYIYGVK